MKKTLTYFIQGLAILVPVIITIYIILNPKLSLAKFF
jgi:uncharacterized membrane protein